MESVVVVVVIGYWVCIALVLHTHAWWRPFCVYMVLALYLLGAFVESARISSTVAMWLGFFHGLGGLCLFLLSSRIRASSLPPATVVSTTRS